MNMCKRLSRVSRICAALLAATLAFAFASHAQTPAPPMNRLSVEPRVPRLGITPCVVELFQDVDTGWFAEPMFEPEFEYAPPPGCPGPWAKVIFSVDLRGPGTTGIANVTFALGDERRDDRFSTTLLTAGAQYNAGQQTWRVERDITEFSALLHQARPGFARDTDYYFRDAYRGDNPRASGRMIFYPATPAQPAPEVPDVIVPVTQTWLTVDPLPRNIERAYLDVYSQLTSFWFSCIPTEAAATWPLLGQTPLGMGDWEPQAGDTNAQGCIGSNYRDVIVYLDGVAVGTAPLYPWLNSDLNLRFERSVDVPVPTPQSLNLMPFRIDLTPYAALLSDGTPHSVQIRYVRAEDTFQGPFDDAHLLLYLDKGSTQVTGGVTRNTLQGTPLEVTTTRNDWYTDGNLLTGDVDRQYRRRYEVAGYVNTSRGRVDTTVKQEQSFTSTQWVSLLDYNAPADHNYAQVVDLASITERTTLRQRGATVLAYDRIRHHYPLRVIYTAGGGSPGGVPTLNHASAYVEQGHHQQGSHTRPAGAYADRVYANFVGSRTFNAVQGIYSGWRGARSHYFNDNAGSCFRERVTWLRENLTSHTQGVGCPDGINRVRGFAHPDGSPENLGWLR
jgi:hypothetical protein